MGRRFRRDDAELALYKRLDRLVATSMCVVGGRGVELDVMPWLRHFGNATYRRLCEAKTLRDQLYDRLRARVDEVLLLTTTNNNKHICIHRVTVMCNYVPYLCRFIVVAIL